MPFTALVWNIENFGTRGEREALRCRLIAEIADEIGADVLVIQEFHEEGRGRLRDITAASARLKNYDWLPGALETNPGSNPVAFRHLAFTGRANSEGYGVLWSDNKLSLFPRNRPKMSAGKNSVDFNQNADGNYVELLFSGKPLIFTAKDVPITFNNQGGSAPLDFPHRVCPARDYHDQQNNKGITQRLDSRRPCRVQLQVANNRVVSLVVYHAPNELYSSLYGTLIGCAVDELQGNDCLYAGDFNLGGYDRSVLTSYLPTIGYSTPSFTASMVQFETRRFVGRGMTQIFVCKGEDQVLHSAIDTAFVKSPQNNDASPVPTVTLRNVLEDIAGANGILRTALSQARAAETQVTNAQAANAPPPPGSLTEFLNGLTSQYRDCVNAYFNATPYPQGLDEYTAAAILCRGFLSDHLPVVVAYPDPDHSGG